MADQNPAIVARASYSISDAITTMDLCRDHGRSLSVALAYVQTRTPVVAVRHDLESEHLSRWHDEGGPCHEPFVSFQ